MTLSVSCDQGVTDCWQIVGHPTGVGWAYYTTTYYHGDHLGSSRFLSSYNGTPMWEATYLPFGQEHAPGGAPPPAPGGQHYKFTGKERDVESGLDYMGARYYTSLTGRFISPDLPGMDQHLTNPQSWNLYAYARNNPLAFTDPTGHAAEDAMQFNHITPMESGMGMNSFGNFTCQTCWEITMGWENQEAFAEFDAQREAQRQAQQTQQQAQQNLVTCSNCTERDQAGLPVIQADQSLALDLLLTAGAPRGQATASAQLHGDKDKPIKQSHVWVRHDANDPNSGPKQGPDGTRVTLAVTPLIKGGSGNFGYSGPGRVQVSIKWKGGVISLTLRVFIHSRQDPALRPGEGRSPMQGINYNKVFPKTANINFP
jgi:RHS repeat-associated protein